MLKEGARTVTALLVAFAVAVWAYHSFISEPERQRQRNADRRADASQRFADWAYVAKAKDIAPGERIKLVVIPSPSGIEFLDTKCLIYTNSEFKTSSMHCPDAKSSDLEVVE